jgi:hypothetical protein
MIAEFHRQKEKGVKAVFGFVLFGSGENQNEL